MAANEQRLRPADLGRRAHAPRRSWWSRLIGLDEAVDLLLRNDRLLPYALALLLIVGWWVGSRLSDSRQGDGRIHGMEPTSDDNQPPRRLPLE